MSPPDGAVSDGPVPHAWAPLYQEVLRQFDLVVGIVDSAEQKAGLVVGFGFLILALVLQGPAPGPLAVHAPFRLAFVAGVISVLMSGYAGIRVLYARGQTLGAEPGDLAQVQRADGDDAVRRLLSRELQRAYRETRAASERKTRILQEAIHLLLVGVILIVATRTLVMVM